MSFFLTDENNVNFLRPYLNNYLKLPKFKIPNKKKAIK
jgi:hypothetical protein